MNSGGVIRSQKLFLGGVLIVKTKSLPEEVRGVVSLGAKLIVAHRLLRFLKGSVYSAL